MVIERLAEVFVPGNGTCAVVGRIMEAHAELHNIFTEWRIMQRNLAVCECHRQPPVCVMPLCLPKKELTEALLPPLALCVHPQVEISAVALPHISAK